MFGFFKRFLLSENQDYPVINADSFDEAHPPTQTKSQQFGPCYVESEFDWKNARKVISSAKNIVFFTGAGISSESGLPIYRSGDEETLNIKEAENVVTTVALHHTPEKVWEWSEGWRINIANTNPSYAHRCIAEIERKHNVHVVTQNLDDLHERAYSSQVTHLHGLLSAPFCASCHNIYSFSGSETSQITQLKKCVCGDSVRTGAVLFGEAVPLSQVQKAEQVISNADLLFVIGSSLKVMPSSRYPFIAAEQGIKIIQINPQKTALDQHATMNIRAGASEAMKKLFDI